MGEDKKIKPNLFIKIQKVLQTEFDQGVFYKKWKVHSNQCLDYMSKTVKGSLCAACDPIGSRRFTQVPMVHKGKQIIGQSAYSEDLQMFSLKCASYLDGLRVIHTLVRNIALAWNHFMDDMKMPVVPKPYSLAKQKEITDK